MDTKIDFNANERKLIDALKQFCTLRNVTPRIAGGWVRDKLLGLESNDIDIALDTMSGYDFAQLFINASTLAHSSMCKINPNPEKSKHLETATLKIENIQVDFLQLRSETYSATRIPTIEVASASVDAHRRDLTINSLFYNIMTEKIEDYTNGLEDLQKRIVRTPLDPRVTFLDDPLRILRVIRFAIRLNFTIDEKIFDALMPADVKMALSQKVSNERIGIEIQKIVNHVDGYKGMLLLVKYGLLDAVFKASKSGSGILTVNQYNAEKVIECVRTDDSVDNDTAYNISLDFTVNFLKCKYKIDRPLFNLYTCLLHYKGQNIGQQYVNSAIVENNLKWTRNFTKRIEMIEKHCETFVGISLNDYDIMFALRKMKDDWLNIFYLLYIYTENEKFVKMIEYVYSKGYHEKLNERPIINGNDIKRLLKCEKHKISEYLECFTVYQIIYDCKDESKLIEHIRSHFGLH